MLTVLRLIYNFCGIQTPFINFQEMLVPDKEQCLLIDSEGDSPIEVSIGISKLGKLKVTRRWLLKPNTTLGEEVWGIRNVHGVDFYYAQDHGLSDFQFFVSAKRFLLQHLDPIPAGHKLQVYFPGTIGVGDKRVMNILREVDYLAEPVGKELPIWKIRETQPYHLNKMNHPHAVPCDPIEHCCYDTYLASRRKEDLTLSERAKLKHGFHCSTADVAELDLFLQHIGHFKRDGTEPDE